MPIFLITGLPGHGKTLHALWSVKRRAESEIRDVFYHNIPELSLSWTELSDPKHWFNCPDGALIVLDECQRVFNRRPNGSLVPPHVQELETHRHRGLDLYLITQHPRLIDAHVRSLVDTHIHVVRPFGKNYAKIFTWQGINDNVDRGHSNAVISRWRYPREIFNYYRSATQHNILSKLPFKVFLFPILIILIVTLFLTVKSNISAINNSTNSASVAAVDNKAVNDNKAVKKAVSPVSQSSDQPVVIPSASEIVAMHVPAVPGIPGTAPLYWPLYSKPVDYPRVTGCIYEPRSKRCQCYSQQGTRLDVPLDMCQGYSESAAFDHSRPIKQVQAMPAMNSLSTPVKNGGM